MFFLHLTHLFFFFSLLFVVFYIFWNIVHSLINKVKARDSNISFTHTKNGRRLFSIYKTDLIMNIHFNSLFYELRYRWIERILRWLTITHWLLETNGMENSLSYLGILATNFYLLPRIHMLTICGYMVLPVIHKEVSMCKSTITQPGERFIKLWWTGIMDENYSIRVQGWCWNSQTSY